MSSRAARMCWRGFGVQRQGPTLCLTAHSDTVGYAGWPDRALNPVIEGDRMVGLGVADDKGGCAAAMLAAPRAGPLRCPAGGQRARRAGDRRGGRQHRHGAPCRQPCRRDRYGDQSGTRRVACDLRRASGLRLDRHRRARRACARVGAREGCRRDRAHGRGDHPVAPARRDHLEAQPGSEERANGVPHRHDSRRHRLRDVSERGRARHRDRHPAGGAAVATGSPRSRRSSPRSSRPSRVSTARFGCGSTATRSPERETRHC